MFGLLITIVLTYSPKVWLQSFVKNPVFLSLGLSGVVLGLFMLNSANISYGWNRLELRGAILGLAIAFASIPKWKEGDLNLLLFIYVLTAFGVSIYTFGSYLLNYTEINVMYLEAKVMPTILNHVRFSIMIAMAVYVSYYLYQQRFGNNLVLRNGLLIISFLLFCFLHVYSVRSGLIAVYGIMILEIGKYVVRTKRYKLGIGLVLSFAILLSIAVHVIPTLNNKWQNTKADFNTYVNNTYPNYSSVTTRLISFDAAIYIFKRHPLTGIGIGDIKDETDLYFREHYPMIDIPILPHNQFLFYLAATGIIGLLFFIGLFYFPLWYKQGYKNKLLLVQYVVLTLSFMTEPMLETQLGMAYSVFFLMLPLNQLYGKSTKLA